MITSWFTLPAVSFWAFSAENAVNRISVRITFNFIIAFVFIIPHSSEIESKEQNLVFLSFLWDITPPPSPPLKTKGRRDVIDYHSNTPLPLTLREGVGGWVKVIKKRENVLLRQPLFLIFSLPGLSRPKSWRKMRKRVLNINNLFLI